MKKYLIVVIFFTGFWGMTNAQEFNLGGMFGKGNLFKLNGGLNTSFLYNFTSDPNNQRDPFTMVLGGNLNLFVAGINVPLSFSYSNAKISVAPPMYFNKFSISPTYKWATLHLGTSSATFSPYTLNGHQYDGVGIDLSPGKLKLKLMTGRLLRGTGNYTANPDQPPVYKRKGFGAIAEYEYKGVNMGLSFFHAKDDSTSAYNIPYEMAVQPKENFVLGLKTNFIVWKEVTVSAEVANNYITQNIGSTLDPVIKKSLFSSLVHLNGTSAQQWAQNYKLGYTWKMVDMGLEYEKVDFGYQCLGSYYNQNGFENTLLRLNFPLLKGKINLSPTLGLQNDLTDSVFSQKGSRLITSLNATYNPTSKLSFSGNFNNNKSVTNYRNLDNIANSNNLIPFYLDSIKLVMLNLTAGINANYQIKATKDVRQTISGGYSLQKGTKKQGDLFVDEEGSQFHNANLTLSTVYPKTTVQWNFTLNYNLSMQGTNSKTKAFGNAASFGKKFMNKKLTTLFGMAFNTTYTDLTRVRVNVFNLRANIGYNYKQRHDFKFSSTFQIKSTSNALKSLNSSSTTGIILLTYNYNF